MHINMLICVDLIDYVFSIMYSAFGIMSDESFTLVRSCDIHQLAFCFLYLLVLSGWSLTSFLQQMAL